MITPISEILGISLDFDHYQERVEKRYAYIKEQLEKDPNWVGYDYVEYFAGRNDGHWLVNKALIDTKGRFYKLNNNVWIKVKDKQNSTYKKKNFTLHNNEVKSFNVNRVMTSTFIPRPKHLMNNPFCELESNHIDGDKHNNDVLNLEWSTSQENTRHALTAGLQKTGINDYRTIPYLATIVMEGPYKNQQFVITGNHGCNVLGISRGSVTECSTGNRGVLAGCKWEQISREEMGKYTLMPPEGYMQYFKDNPHLANPQIKPCLATIVSGPNFGYQFCLFGTKEMRAHGFKPESVSLACRAQRRYAGCTWKHVSQLEALNYPHGASAEIINTIGSSRLSPL